MAAKVIVWLPLAMLKVRTTSVAAFRLASPACEAVIWHEPAPVMWTLAVFVAASSEQSPVAFSATSRPEVELALMPKSASPNVLSRIAAKVIVWSALLTVWL